MRRHRFVSGRSHRWITLAIAAGVSWIGLREMTSAIDYLVPGSVYIEDFNSLPTGTNNNGSIESFYPEGWKDDTTTVETSHVSVPGWYLYHPLSPAAENGFNGNQRFRMGFGQNTGGFWGFGSSSGDSDKALGSLGSTTVAANDANMYMAVRLVNNTGGTLTSFSLTYNGEQWRDGESPSGETLLFGYSLSANVNNWFSAATFTPISSLNFTSPVVEGIAASGTPVDGNIGGRVADITGTVSDISWQPGAELWLRWSDPQLSGNQADDGLAIDDVRFSAVPEPTGLPVVAVAAIALFGCRRRR